MIRIVSTSPCWEVVNQDGEGFDSDECIPHFATEAAAAQWAGELTAEAAEERRVELELYGEADEAQARSYRAQQLTVSCFELICDEKACSSVWDATDEGATHLDVDWIEWDVILENGWRRVDGRHFCPEHR